MKQRPAIYLISGAFNGLISLAMIALGGVLIYEASFRFANRGFSDDQLWVGMAFLLNGLSIALFVGTTIRRSVSQPSDTLLDSPKSVAVIPELSAFQKIMGVVAFIAAIALVLLAIYIYDSFHFRDGAIEYAIPPQTIVAIAAMLLGGISIPLYVIGQWRRGGRRIDPH